MDTSISISETGEGPLAMLAKPAASRPTLTLPPRSPADSFFKPSDTTTPSPMTFVSSLFADNDPYADYKSFSQLLAGAMGSPGVRFGGGLGEPEGPTNTNQGTDEGTEGSQALSSQGVGVSSSSGQVIPSPARANTAKFKSMMPSRLPIPRSPYLTIPPGLSPTTLLDSPVLVSMGQILSSPTTGTFPVPPFSHDVTALGHEGSKDSSDGSSNFVFRPHPQLPLSPLASMGPFGLSHQQALAQVHAQAQSQAVPNSSAVDTSVFECKPLVSSAQKLPVVLEDAIERPAVPTGEPLEKVSSSHLSAPPLPPPHLVERPSEDGYNWRKYGQKQVKGSEYPRSYYKCTYANCPVKKKVERSYDGHITEIVYKGDHSHTKPQSTRRGGSNPTDVVGRETSHSSAVEGAENSFGLGTVDGDKLPLDASCTVRGLYSGGIMVTPEPSLGSLSEDELEDGDAVRGEDGGDDETDSKRRRIEKARESLVNPPLRTIREPRVVVQTTSEVDILDDGYRWRKYGQKVVKGNPHPRSYYKCTNVGCSVRKHVERSSTDVTAVITTYEGKHNHDVPAARNSSHDTSTAAAVAPPPSTGQGLSSAKIIPKPVPSLQEQVFGGFGSSALMHNAMMSNENVSHLGPDMSARNMVRSSLIGAMPHRESDFFSQDATLKPKEEPGDAHPVGSSLQPVYQSNSSSLVTQRLSY